MKKILYGTCCVLCMLILSACGKEPVCEVSVRHKRTQAPVNETVELDWKKLSERLPDLTKETVVVKNAAGEEIASQVIFRGGDEPIALIFQVDVTAGDSATYFVSKGKPAEYPLQVYGRLVPERKDDFAWENNKTAWRMYGPALEATGEISNGIDVWVKSTEELIIDKWYKQNDYHKDHGQGLDCYKVGRTLGAGAMAPYVDGELILANNFISAEILDAGPIRLTFKLTYAPFRVEDRMLTETRTISLDANSYFNRIEERFENSRDGMTLAAGIVLREISVSENYRDVQMGEYQKSEGKCAHWLSYWEPKNTDNQMDNGHTGLAVLKTGNVETYAASSQHYFMCATYEPGQSLVYYNGSCWSKGGVASQDEWKEIIQQKMEALLTPLEVCF